MKRKRTDIPIGKDVPILFNADKHTYKGKDTGKNYTSVSHFLNSLQEEFDTEGISWNVARKQLREKLDDEPTEEQIKLEQDDVKAQWKAAADESNVHGNWIHDGVSDFLNTGTCPEDLMNIAREYKTDVAHYFKFFSEKVMVWSDTHRIAGRPDGIGIRQNTYRSLVDIDDIKTNLKKGIQFHSMKLLPNNKLRHYNRKFLPPLDYLEDCNYIRYALQLSTYALCIEECYEMAIGKLAIVFVGKRPDESLYMRRIPVPYMKAAVELALNKRKVKFDIQDEPEDSLGQMDLEDI